MYQGACSSEKHWMNTGFRSPVVVIKSDPSNASRINTMIVADVTSNLSLAGAPVNVLMEQSESGLPKASVIDVSQILAVDKSFLTQ